MAKSDFLGVFVVPGNAEIVVTAQINVVVGRIAVLIDVQIFFGEVDVIFEHVPRPVSADRENLSKDISGKETVAIGGLTFTSRPSTGPVPSTLPVLLRVEKPLEAKPPQAENEQNSVAKSEKDMSE